jgi:hypothetical protein
MGRSSIAAKPQGRDADTKLAQGRLSVLELAKELGNVAEACRQRGLDRSRPCKMGAPRGGRTFRRDDDRKWRANHVEAGQPVQATSFMRKSDRGSEQGRIGGTALAFAPTWPPPLCR